MHGIGVGQDIGRRDRGGHGVRFLDGHARADTWRLQATFSRPGCGADDLRHTTDDRLHGPVVRAWQMPEREADLIAALEYARGPFTGSQVFDDPMVEAAYAVKLDGQDID